MKRIITLLFSALFIFSCVVSPTESPEITTTEEIGGSDRIIVEIDTGSSSRGVIDIIESEIVQAVVTITAPDGTTESRTWLKNGVTTLSFNSQGPGSYRIDVTETDSAGNESSYGATFQVKKGINIILLISPGSNIIVDITPPAPLVTYSFRVEAVNRAEGTGTIGPASTVSGSYEPGTLITVEATADADNVFSGWFDATTDGNLISTQPGYSFNITGDTALYARFIKNSHVVTFADPILEGLVRGAISKPSGSLTYGDVKNITSLKKNTFTNGQWIGSLEGLQYLTALQSIDILNHSAWGGTKGNITDLSPLTNLRALKVIHLGHNRIIDLTPLANHSALSEINFAGNQISDLTPLQNLTALTSINFANNQLSEITVLSGLTALNYLNLGGNRISDLTPLNTLVNINRLYLNGNGLSDISALPDLPALTELWLINNGITDITSLLNNSGLGNGDNLYIKTGNSISQADLNSLSAKRIRVN